MVLPISYLEVVFFQVQNIVILVLWVLFLGLKIYAFADCVRRPAQAFAAVGRQSKPLWLVLTGISALAGLIFQDPLGLLGIAGLVASLVYLFDVRPRIQEILNNRW
ncbi:MAG: DUF2516 family protein [Actinobacteria bacterium]|uniref:Unannotated protein n=1 Tax=freshwater metagenome TaxID=449393 RepID=A0A6J7SDD2_9ZZZZ|nr:DUF2516 family protein [Actinomycetota bacterium]MTB27959.1 DUF2516 family protein [Actinomycetota bacterium]